ncbi:MAG TPA: carboxypeptidase regulatory-like domain-containing protein [Bryobacteraceae bacterium]|nr:carboxypeptidase regulatory-like domain-containing protein [Bryobacteraceae bacterium]
MRRWAAIAVVMGALAATASGYYHYIHYTTHTAPFTAAPEKFDLRALHNKTVYYYVSNDGPAAMAEGDSFAALLGQLRMAGRIWDQVETSDLRVAYGGLITPGTPQSTPHIEVLFDDTPGVIAMGGPISRAELVTGPEGPFVPITTSVIILNRDLSGRPSHDALAMTIVHEMGHALGLQHTLTSSMMSTEVTRASTPAKPLGPDDIAAISLLYPNEKFASRFGSLTGQVKTSDGNGVHLASVVALTHGGRAVSALTAPDGTYRIDGLPPQQYYVYVHALPPSVQPELGPSEIVLPKNPDGEDVPAGEPFRAQFYPGTVNPNEAATVKVVAGETASGIDFEVERRGAPELHSITTWSFPCPDPQDPTCSGGQKAVSPAYVHKGILARSFLVAAGPGLMPGGTPAPGLNVSLLGGDTRIAPHGVYPYLQTLSSYLQINFQFTPFSAPGPRHLVFSAGDELYVLPSGLNVVESTPPWIASVTPETDGEGNRVVSIEGKGLTARTRILFDGLEARVLEFDGSAGRIRVRPPSGPSGHHAKIVALNPDGQTSLFVADPAVYAYEGPEEDAPFIVLSAASLPAGAESMIEVEGINTHFVEGETVLGFGSSDVVVKRLWVLSPTRLRANVAVAPNAPATTTLVSATTGFRVFSQPYAFEIQPPNPDSVVVNSDVVNPETNSSWIYPGSLASVAASNIAAGSMVQVTLNDIPVEVTETAENRVTFRIPGEMAPGTAILRVQSGSETSFPVVISVGLPPPVVTAVLLGGIALDAGQQAYPGDMLTVRVSGLDTADWIDPGRVRVNIGGIDHRPVAAVERVAEEPGLHAITILLAKEVAGGPQPVVAVIDDRISAPFEITVAGSVE